MIKSLTSLTNCVHQKLDIHKVPVYWGLLAHIDNPTLNQYHVYEVIFMGINGGRSRRGIEEEGFIRYQITLPPSISERLEKFCADEERPKSWTIQKALDEWLKKKGY